ncbi:hypothetical protein Y032_0039g151 [Ancylostoma ceylanicum]|uniref:DUF4371 domain-containing protein n=1 Tax=Ancylostoma ceylanicum TaxID=53326 RepID=A0A016UIQ5_9BILA|nr:hypothetical protein Y032_0039g151 [Ancylostoma ceylanicum]
MEEAETGANIFGKLCRFSENVSLIREMTWNLVAVATDGASNMIADGGLQVISNLNASQGRLGDLTQSRATAARIDAVTDKPLIWLHCMTHKIELALSDASMENDEGRRQQSHFYKWRSFTTKYSNRLRNLFGTSRRVLVEAGELLEDAPFLRLKKVIDIRWASSERGIQ